MRKWITNICLLIAMLAMTMLFCGFEGEGYSCATNTETQFTYRFEVKEGVAYKVFEEVTEGDENSSTIWEVKVYVPLGEEVTVPVEAVITPVGENYPGVEPEGESTGLTYPEEWTITINDSQATIDGITVGVNSCAKDETNIITAKNSFTVPATAEEKTFDVFNATLGATGNAVNLTVSTITVTVIATDIDCDHCGGKVDVNGEFVHNPCEVCEGMCNGTEYIHNGCEVCGESCVAPDHVDYNEGNEDSDSLEQEGESPNTADATIYGWLVVMAAVAGSVAVIRYGRKVLRMR